MIYIPQKAFFNLPPQRQEEILEKTMELYSQHPYPEVTLQHLLQTLSLNPATFYRYFSDKDELFLYAHSVISDKQEPLFQKSYEEHDCNIFSMFEPSPTLSKLEKDFNKAFDTIPNDVLLRFILEVAKNQTFPKAKNSLRQLRAQNRVHADIDDDLISFMYATTMFNMNLFFREYGITDEELKTNLKKNFYTGFFQRGILKDPEHHE